MPAPCYHCAQQNPRYNCSKCKTAKYCNDTCQRSERRNHKIWCNIQATVISTPSTNEMPEACYYELKAIPGKGMGMLATKAIPRGTRILTETPLFKLNLTRGETKIAAALKTLSAKDIERFLRLANCRPEIPLLSAIFETNALPCGLNGGGNIATSAGLFIAASRFNSSCRPNVNNTWNEATQTIRIHALRDITEGEELCLCYTSMMGTKAERQECTQRKFAFTCTCTACQLTGMDASISDARRKEIAEFQENTWTPATSPQEWVSKVRRALILLEEEEIYVFEAAFAYDAFQLCVATSDLRNSRAWIQKAVKAATLSFGADDEMTMRFKGYAQAPKSHRNWGCLPKATLTGPA